MQKGGGAGQPAGQAPAADLTSLGHIPQLYAPN
jgi:hypothetical protein